MRRDKQWLIVVVHVGNVSSPNANCSNSHTVCTHLATDLRLSEGFLKVLHSPETERKNAS